ncbi:hypothetical protein LAD64_24200 [Klebsiella pneumoniae]|nr:hypothetical protein [Klebsiella pneumoniae]
MNTSGILHDFFSPSHQCVAASKTIRPGPMKSKRIRQYPHRLPQIMSKWSPAHCAGAGRKPVAGPVMKRYGPGNRPLAEKPEEFPQAWSYRLGAY